MKLLPLFLFGAALGASGAAAKPPRPIIATPPPPVPADCPLVIGFASYGAGIDGGALRVVEALLGADRAVRGVSRHNWGREGEVTLCARTRSRADAARLFRAIRARIPARPRGPITIRTREGLRFEAPARP